MNSDVLTETIIGCAYTVANALGNGFLEKVYENALAYELGKKNMKVGQQSPIPVHYAAHIAYAEAGKAKFITCDDRLVNKCAKHAIATWYGGPVYFCAKEDLR